jgi:hypothetical protein
VRELESLKGKEARACLGSRLFLVWPLVLLLSHCFFEIVETVAGLGVLAAEAAGADKKVLCVGTSNIMSTVPTISSLDPYCNNIIYLTTFDTTSNPPYTTATPEEGKSTIKGIFVTALASRHRSHDVATAMG